VRKQFISNKYRLMFISPWLMAASIGLLILIIAVSAANNLQRTRNLLTENLFHRGQMLVRFVGAGMRASMRMGPQGARRSNLLNKRQKMRQFSILQSLIVMAPL